MVDSMVGSGGSAEWEVVAVVIVDWCRIGWGWRRELCVAGFMTARERMERRRRGFMLRFLMIGSWKLLNLRMEVLTVLGEVLNIWKLFLRISIKDYLHGHKLHNSERNVVSPSIYKFWFSNLCKLRYLAHITAKASPLSQHHLFSIY